MRIPRGRLHLRVTEQLANHRKAFTQGQGPGRKGVAQFTHHDSTGVICKPMLSPTREAGECAGSPRPEVEAP